LLKACTCLVAAALIASAAPVNADEFPSRTIRMVVAFPAGGPTDFVARLLAEKLRAIFNRSVIVENKPGANGAVGADFVARSEPDGHTLFLTTVGAVAITPNLRTDLPYQPLRDFTPITRVVRNTTMLVVNAGAPFNSAKDLAAAAQQKPGAVPIASTGVGSMPHFALELYQAAANVKFLHVPYRGAAPALTDLLGGQVQAMFADVPVLMGQIQSGKIKPLGAASNIRAETLKEVPTLSEQGYRDTHAENWYALLAPAKTPAAVVARLHAAMLEALSDPETNTRLVQSGATPAPTSPEDLRTLMQTELERWGRIIREKGIKGEP
jgi:tripartite-type tricarboxylate transporter receptor subunit TctC